MIHSAQRTLTATLAAFGVAALLTACGGGGGTTAQTGGNTYAGVTSPANITSTNAAAITSSMVGSSDAGGNVFSNTLSQKAAKASADGNQPRATVTLDGLVTGFVTANDNTNANGIGSLSMVFNNFSDGGGSGTLNGGLSMWIDAVDLLLDPVIATLQFQRLSLLAGTTVNINLDGSMAFSGTTVNINLDGSMAFNDIATPSTATLNYDVIDQVTGEQTRYENIMWQGWPGNGLACNTSESFSGRFYDANFGYADVTTTAPLTYSINDCVNLNWSGGGPLLFVGADNSKTAVTPLSNTTYRLEVDANGDGSFETTTIELW